MKHDPMFPVELKDRSGATVRHPGITPHCQLAMDIFSGLITQEVSPHQLLPEKAAELSVLYSDEFFKVYENTMKLRG